MNKLPEKRRPWNISFSYGRALQASCLKVSSQSKKMTWWLISCFLFFQAWQGKDENIPAAQQAFFERAKANGEATLGKYAGGSGGEGSSESLFISNYKY